MKRLLFLISLLILLGSNNISKGQGLRFFGNEKTISERSSLLIPGESNKALRNFEIEFDLRIDNPSSPGYIFHVRDRQGGDAFSLMYRKDSQTDSVMISFTKDGEKALMELRESLGNVRDHSLRVRVKIDCMADIANVDLGPHSFECRNLGLSKDGLMPELYFGINRHIVETASYMLRNLEIAFDEKRLVIPLDERAGSEVHSSDGRVVGKIDNPNWLIDSHRKWEKLIEFSSQTPTGIAFDQEHNRFYSYNADTLRTYDVLTNKLQAKAMEGNGKLPTKFGMNFYDPWREKIIPYEIYYNNMSAEIDPATDKWEMSNRKESDMALHHHAHALLPGGKEAILFGGYGDRRYFNSILRFNLSELTFDTLKIGGNIIPPRFFAGMMMTNSGDSVYIYGGKGNNEGKQDLGVRYYYDMYLVDLKNGISKKLWERPAPEKDRVPARTLIGCPDGGSVYAMVYSEYEPHSSLQLYQIDIATGEEIAVGDTIPMISEEIATNVALYSAPFLDKLFCVVQEFEKYGETTTRIYSISTPVLPLSAQYKSSEESERKWIVWILAGICMGTVFIYVLRAVGKTRKMTKAQEEVAKTTTTLEIMESSNIKIDENSYEQSFRGFDEEEPHENSIQLFGQFLVFDAHGRDITYMFSTTLKSVFIYVLMSTLCNKGISSQNLSEVFWPDRSPDKVKNLRNVTMAKLRKILNEINGIKLIYAKGMFLVEMEKPCSCDAWELSSYSDGFRNVFSQGVSDDRMLAIMRKGKFLQGLHDPIFDDFKGIVENYVCNYLSAYIPRCYKEKRYDLTAKLCRTMLSIDSNCETALLHIVGAYRMKGENEKANSFYNKFVKNYRETMGEDYKLTYEELISRI